MVPRESGAEQRRFDVHEERLKGNRWLWRLDKGLKAVSIEVLHQLAKMPLLSDENLDDYFVRNQELMTRLDEAG